MLTAETFSLMKHLFKTVETTIFQSLHLENFIAGILMTVLRVQNLQGQASK